MNDDIEKLRSNAIREKAKRNYEVAFDLFNKILETRRADLADYYFFGELNIIMNDYYYAESVLTQCIEIGQRDSNKWFAGSAYILRAYARIKLNKKDKALSDIAYLEENHSDTSITWLQRHGQPIIDLELLKKMI